MEFKRKLLSAILYTYLPMSKRHWMVPKKGLNHSYFPTNEPQKLEMLFIVKMSLGEQKKIIICIWKWFTQTMELHVYIITHMEYYLQKE